MDTHGHSLPELILVLTLGGIISALAAPPIADWRDDQAVRAARDDLVYGIARARLAAVSQGGARLVVDARSAEAWIRTRSDSTSILGSGPGVVVELGGRDRLEIRFDAFGIGRVASGTITLRRRDALAGITVSAYGGVRRW